MNKAEETYELLIKLLNLHIKDSSAQRFIINTLDDLVELLMKGEKL